MLSNLLVSELSKNVFNTIVLSVVLIFFYFIIRYIFCRKVKSSKERGKISARVLYVIIVVFMFFVAKIWVTGFTHVFYALSLVSAGLVVTNKETIMNFVAFLVITWRGIFSKGDYICLLNYSGYVFDIGVLYFKLLEVSPAAIDRASGKMIKIPNGLIINNPVVNYTLDTNFIEYKQTWLFTQGSDIKAAKAILLEKVQHHLDAIYKDSKKYSSDYVRKKNKFLGELIDMKVHIKSEIKPDKPSGVLLIVSFYCYPKDYDALDETIRMEILAAIKDASNVSLAYSD